MQTKFLDSLKHKNFGSFSILDPSLHWKLSNTVSWCSYSSDTSKVNLMDGKHLVESLDNIVTMILTFWLCQQITS